MLELPPEVEDRLRQKAAQRGLAVVDYLRQIAEQPFGITEGQIVPKPYLEREGEDWTEEDMKMELQWVTGKRFPT